MIMHHFIFIFLNLVFFKHSLSSLEQVDPRPLILEIFPPPLRHLKILILICPKFGYYFICMHVISFVQHIFHSVHFEIV